MPPGIVLVSVDRISGAPEAASAPTAIPEAFKSGTEPGSASYLEQTAVQSQETKTTGPGTTVDQGTGGLY
jgi:penicillin-binding protein 1A